MSSPAVEPLTCDQLVELVTEYLEGALPAHDARRFEEHLDACPGCAEYLDQIRKTVALAGGLREESIPPAVRDRLLHAYRDWWSNG